MRIYTVGLHVVIHHSYLGWWNLFCRWCGPCRTLGPLLEEEVGGRKGRVELAKVDVDKLQELAVQYDVSNCPPLPPEKIW